MFVSARVCGGVGVKLMGVSCLSEVQLMPDIWLKRRACPCVLSTAFVVCGCCHGGRCSHSLACRCLEATARCQAHGGEESDEGDEGWRRNNTYACWVKREDWQARAEEKRKTKEEEVTEFATIKQRYCKAAQDRFVQCRKLKDENKLPDHVQRP